MKFDLMPKLTAHEAATRLMFERRRTQLQMEKGPEFWDRDEHIIARVFKVEWASALPVEQIENIARALFRLPLGEALNLGPALTRLVKAGVLRSRLSSKRRLYEVNY